MKPHKYVLVNLALVLVSMFGYLLFLIPCFLYSFIKVYIFKDGNVKDKNFELSNWLWNLAIANDQAGNALIKFPGNDILLKPNRTKSFGDPNETISHVLGWGEYDKALYKPGKKISKGLNKIDKGHTVNAKNNKQ